MSERTKIEWCDDTHNFWRGCRRRSPGCDHCYAEALVERFHGKGSFAKRVRSKDFEAPLRWNHKPFVCDECSEAFDERVLNTDRFSHTTKKDGTVVLCNGKTFHRRRVFALSLGDWLDEEVPIEWPADMLDVIRRCPNLDFLLLTKRPENFAARMFELESYLSKREDANEKDGRDEKRRKAHGTPVTDPMKLWWINWVLRQKGPANIWIGCTVENQEYADKRIPELLKIPAVCRFLSYEPALGPVDFTRVHLNDGTPTMVNALSGEIIEPGSVTSANDLPRADWIIVGGESGPKARPFNIEWARSTVAQCQAAGVAYFVKQMGTVPMMESAKAYRMKPNEIIFSEANQDKVPQGFSALRFWDKKGGDMAEWPADLQRREFPRVEVAA